jgi:hypothetical protein
VEVAGSLSAVFGGAVYVSRNVHSLRLSPSRGEEVVAMIIPVGMPVPTPMGASVSLEVRIRKLEHDLGVACQLIEVLLQRLEVRLGPEFSTASLLQAGAPAERLAESAEAVAHLNDLLKAGEDGQAARFFRDSFGVTWDQAHAIVREWSSMTSEHKVNLFASALKKSP